jgi:hypothetical protein
MRGSNDATTCTFARLDVTGHHRRFRRTMAQSRFESSACVAVISPSLFLPAPAQRLTTCGQGWNRKVR